jgi:hypothetical protein
MKSILTEIVLSGGAILFWALALPAAAVAFPAIALWKKIAGALVTGSAPAACRRPSPATA